jgi:hypothetical protein
VFAQVFAQSVIQYSALGHPVLCTRFARPRPYAHKNAFVLK